MRARSGGLCGNSGGLRASRRVAAVLLAAAVVACVDESHELQVQALGGEAPGVSPGPLHRPGQPCLVCHGEPGPASHKFVMAGTVYAVQRPERSGCRAFRW